MTCQLQSNRGEQKNSAQFEAATINGLARRRESKDKEGARSGRLNMHFHFGSRGRWLVLFCVSFLLFFKAPTSDIFSLSGSELSLSVGTGRRMRLCCADGEKCDIHNAFPIRGSHAWTHLATCQRETDSGRMRINCLSMREEVVVWRVEGEVAK